MGYSCRLVDEGNDGLARFYVPMGLGLGLGGAMAILRFKLRSFAKGQTRFIIGLIYFLLGGLLGYVWQLFDEGWRTRKRCIAWWPLMMMSLIIMTFYLLNNHRNERDLGLFEEV